MNRLLTGLTLTLMSSMALAGGMRVVSVAGQVTVATPAAQPIPLKMGEVVDGDFIVHSGADGEAQVRDAEGTTLMVRGNSEVAVSRGGERFELKAGGVGLLAGKDYRAIDAMGYNLRTNGYLNLRLCHADCREVDGLYGQALSGETIVEYRGGRSILRSKSFLASGEGSRPRILAATPSVLANSNQFGRAVEAKVQLAGKIESGVQAFKQGDYGKARQALDEARQESPLNPSLLYYLGLSALELKDNDAALNYLQTFNKEAPEEAKAKGSNQLLTLLMSNQLREEAKLAVQNEATISTQPPEPNSVAVYPFVSRKDATYQALAKGIAAMVISDLSVVPGLKVLEREKVQKLIDEINLSGSGLVSEDSLVRSGRLMRAGKVVVGSFGAEK